MRIAQVAPMFESVPPTHYGGTERVVWCLAEELVRRGHDVTLFASGDSQTSARLYPTTPRALRKQMTRDEMVAIAPEMHRAMLGDVYRQAGEFDIIHSHVEQLTLPFIHMVQTPTLLTMHSPLDPVFWIPVLRLYPPVPMVSISESQRDPLRGEDLDWVATVHNGIPLEHFSFSGKPGEYLAYLGRIAPEKGPDRAVEIARQTGMPLKVGAKVDPLDHDYWENEIAPLFRANGVEYLGELDECEKAELLRGAYATLFPVGWPEPFGLVMPESLACGTPVVAMRRGSVPEIVRDGVSGYVCDSLEAMVAAIPKVAELSREACRREAQRFSMAAMASSYERAYGALIGDAAVRPKAADGAMTPRAEEVAGKTPANRWTQSRDA